MILSQSLCLNLQGDTNYVTMFPCHSNFGECTPPIQSTKFSNYSKFCSYTLAVVF